ncbi:UvrABC system protein B [uncultured archaeon]|nr:UvrABC system protein B [uncultured archaeon]
MKLTLHSKFSPAGDQPKAIDSLSKGVAKGLRHQTLLGVTGSGKTYTMAKVMEETQKPALVISHNKTLAAQLYGEFKEFFPENAVEYFVSYYDYYQPEAYIPQSDTYISKDADINEEIDRLRHSATRSLLDRRDTIVVASVSCIYSLGDPKEYKAESIPLEVSQLVSRRQLMEQLVLIHYTRNDAAFEKGTFRVRGNRLDIRPPYGETYLRVVVEDRVEGLEVVHHVTGKTLNALSNARIYPAVHYVMSEEQKKRAVKTIESELESRVSDFQRQGKLVEAQRIEQRTRYDLEMINEMGYCSGIENYSRHFDGRSPGEPPFTLMDYFPNDYLLFVDESHMTLPQIKGMYRGDRARKDILIEYGFRLPSAVDNRPLTYEEFSSKFNQVIYVSATPSKEEISLSQNVVEQIIRPTGLVDPEVEVRPTKNQIDDLIGEIKARAVRKERVLVTTLTKRMAEDLADYLADAGVKANYLHSDVETLDRVDVLRNLRLGEFDCVVGVNLLREGLDLPEVTLVAILDADKEGFLRSEVSLIQTIGRVSRNVRGKVILYADRKSKAMDFALRETARRRALQTAYNRKHGITPVSVEKAVRDRIAVDYGEDRRRVVVEAEGIDLAEDDVRRLMTEAAGKLDFEGAAYYRDLLKKRGGSL